jgi:hypothetical protein
MFRKFLPHALLGVAACLALPRVAFASDWLQTLCPSAAASSDPSDKDTWSLTLSPFTHHWNYNPDHKTVNLVGLDKLGADERFCGAALFTNSFGQLSTYVYAGKEWPRIGGSEHWFVKVSGGLLYGYRGAYQDKIPFNNYGIAPAIIPSLGYRFNDHDSAQLILLGDAALMFAYGHSF